eukprot:36603-Eustigmatos_ZCMA.PRE.1
MINSRTITGQLRTTGARAVHGSARRHPKFLYTGGMPVQDTVFLNAQGAGLLLSVMKNAQFFICGDLTA